MRDLNQVIKLYFQKISSYNILHGEVDFRNFPQEDFKALALQELKYRSETETDGLFRYLGERTEENAKESSRNVFRALKEVASRYLLIREDKPVCRYDKLLQWRELVQSVGEDLPICAFLAKRTEEGKGTWNDFEWNVVIGHDNMQLNRLMEKGISDNHFHLFGSAPAFQLIWINLMNYVTNNRYRESLEKIDKEKRVTRNKYSIHYQEDSLVKMHLQAALIRLILVRYIDIVRRGDSSELSKLWERKKEIESILTEKYPIEFCKEKLQLSIDSIKWMKQLVQKDDTEDYANLSYSAGSINHEFEGERALFYHMLLGYIDNRPIPEFLLNWFYAYLVIQLKFREELVQVNDNIGFANFSQYSGRKKNFLFGAQDDKRMVQHAVLGSLELGNIRSLEMRITPQRTMKENRIWIQTCDDYLKEYLSEEQLKNIYYVLHFPKRMDEEQVEKHGRLLKCRHSALRKELEEKADELILLRENAPEEAARILGIDACAMEIDCRPEVFGSAFRLLTNHVVEKRKFGEVKQWKMTYHGGEDWRDIVDGLRTIDEAVLFLNMKNGDRLGHATVLGIDVKKWYQRKERKIYLPRQEYLDNVVWLYYKLLEFDAPNCETLKGLLCSEFEKNFRIIYRSLLETTSFQYNMDDYYEAWKLRGDNPELYRSGRFDGTPCWLNQYWLNQKIPDGAQIRKRKEIADLVCYYHYSADVRWSGMETIPIDVTDIYMDGVEKVQKGMRQMIAKCGICIETNPSSNVLISSIENYQEHPISKMFNMGLVMDSKELQKSTQLHVSVNTDDKGVFHTSLENEYALLGCAMEHVTDENGEQKYQKQMVYQWLDYIREYGNQQSFQERMNDKNIVLGEKDIWKI